MTTIGQGEKLEFVGFVVIGGLRVAELRDSIGDFLLDRESLRERRGNALKYGHPHDVTDYVLISWDAGMEV